MGGGGGGQVILKKIHGAYLQFVHNLRGNVYFVHKLCKNPGKFVHHCQEGERTIRTLPKSYSPEYSILGI